MSTNLIKDHLQALGTGDRLPATAEEQHAVEYVRATLANLGIEDMRLQNFAASSPVRLPLLPSSIVRRGKTSKLTSAAMLLGLAYFMRRRFQRQPFPLHSILSRGESQNVIARIPPSGETKHLLFVIAHLNTEQRQRLLPPTAIKLINTAALVLTVISALSMLFDVLINRRRRSRWQRALVLIALAYDLTRVLKNEIRDNADSVAVLLDLAEQLQAQPLEHTEVTLVFAGGAASGIDAYLEQYTPPRDQSTLIDLETPSVGNLHYVTKHGVSYLTEYRPAPRITALARQVALDHPELGVTGASLPVIDAVAPLRRRGYEALGIAGYEPGTLLGIEDSAAAVPAHYVTSDPLARAVTYLHELVTAVDAKSTT